MCVGVLWLFLVRPGFQLHDHVSRLGLPPKRSVLGQVHDLTHRVGAGQHLPCSMAWGREAPESIQRFHPAMHAARLVPTLEGRTSVPGDEGCELRRLFSLAIRGHLYEPFPPRERLRIKHLG
jgi:hypothetical protein